MLGWKLEEMRTMNEPQVYLIPDRLFEINLIATDVADLLFKIAEYPKPFWSNLTNSYESK